MNDNDSRKPIVTSDTFRPIRVRSGITISDLERLFSEPSDTNNVSTVQPEPDWIWDGILLRGQMSLLVGDWKIGKTTFLAELIRHISSGTPYLGFRVNSTTVSVVTEEAHGLWIRRNREKALPSSLRIWSHQGSDESHFYDLPRYIGMANATRPGLIIVDSIGRLLSPGAEGNATVMARCLDQVLQAADNASLLLVHHPSKSRSRGGNSRGSKLLPSAAHAVLELLPYSINPADGNRRLLRIRSRLPPSPTTLAYEWYPDEQRITGIAPHLNAFECCVIKTIRTLLTSRPDGCGTVENLPTDWPAGADPISRTTLLRRLRIATDRHELIRKGRGVNSDPFVYSLGPSSSRTVIAKGGD